MATTLATFPKRDRGLKTVIRTEFLGGVEFVIVQDVDETDPSWHGEPYRIETGQLPDLIEALQQAQAYLAPPQGAAQLVGQGRLF